MHGPLPGTAGGTAPLDRTGFISTSGWATCPPEDDRDIVTRMGYGSIGGEKPPPVIVPVLFAQRERWSWRVRTRHLRSALRSIASPAVLGEYPDRPGCQTSPHDDGYQKNVLYPVHHRAPPPLSISAAHLCRPCAPWHTSHWIIVGPAGVLLYVFSAQFWLSLCTYREYTKVPMEPAWNPAALRPGYRPPPV